MTTLLPTLGTAMTRPWWYVSGGLPTAGSPWPIPVVQVPYAGRARAAARPCSVTRGDIATAPEAHAPDAAARAPAGFAAATMPNNVSATVAATAAAVRVRRVRRGAACCFAVLGAMESPALLVPGAAERLAGRSSSGEGAQRREWRGHTAPRHPVPSRAHLRFGA